MAFLYIASRTEQGGIYKYVFDGKKYVEKSFFLMNNPMYMIVSENAMHVLLRAPFENKESGYVRYDMQENGDLINPTPILSTKGEIACHLYQDRGNVYCVNYTSGSVIKLPDTLIVHKGEKQSHTHYVGVTPDNKYLCVTDLGLDKIFLYDKDLQLKGQVVMPKNCGVRHLVFDNKGYIFTANELDATAAVLKYENGNMRLLDTVSCVPDSVKEKSAPSAIRLYKDKIYVGVRGSNLIARLSFENDKLNFENAFPCGGDVPRDFYFDENRLICCNQSSNTVTIFEEHGGEFKLIQTMEIKEPICVITN